MKKFFTLLCMALIGAMGYAQEEYNPADHTCVVSGTENLCSGGWSSADAMVYDAADGLWKITLQAKDTKVIEFKIVYDGEWYGDENGNNYQFMVEEVSDVNITFDPNTLLATYAGDKVIAYDPNKIDFVIVAGSSALLNGADWDVNAEANKMTAEDDGYYQLELKDVAAGSYNFKFTANGSWAKQWGAVEGSENLENGVATAAQGGSNPPNFAIKLEKGATYNVTLTLDIMDAENPMVTAEWTKSGDAVITEDIYSLAGSFNGWNQTDESTEMTKVSEGIYKFVTSLQAGEHRFKVVKNHDWSEAWPAYDYVLELEQDADVTITIDFTSGEGVVSVETAECSVFFVTLNVETALEALNVYACQGEAWDQLTGGWPGTAMTAVEGGFTYLVKVTKGQTLQLIFNYDNTQTENIMVGEITANTTLNYKWDGEGFGEGSSIESLKAANASSAIYTIAGQRVSKPVRGLYIMGGKKVLVK